LFLLKQRQNTSFFGQATTPFVQVDSLTAQLYKQLIAQMKTSWQYFSQKDKLTILFELQ
jgi:hypothetical protein